MWNSDPINWKNKKSKLFEKLKQNETNNQLLEKRTEIK